MENILKKTGLRILFFLLILFGSYYFLFLKPGLEIPTALLETQKVLALHHSNLLQNRVALVELTKLNPDTTDFNNRKTILFMRLQETNKAGLSALDDQHNLPTIAGAPNESLNFLNNELHPAFSLLLKETRAIFTEQQILINFLVALDKTVSNIFLYDPTNDLGKLDLTSDKDRVIERAQFAMEGLEKISENLKLLNITQNEMVELQDKIQQTRTTLESFIHQTENSNLTKASDSRTEIINYFYTLKQDALAAQMALIHADESVKLLTRQTNLILQYDFWLKKVSYHQTRLNKEKN